MLTKKRNKMKFKLLFLLIISQILPSCTHQNASKQNEPEQLLQLIPKAPRGYEWTYFKGIAILKPHNWTDYKIENTYITSLEPFKEKGIFETGLTIQVLRNVQAKYKNPASVVALSLIQDIADRKENRQLSLSVNDKSVVKSIIYRFRNASVAAVPIIVHKFFLINDKESYVYVITFESPEKTWKKYWNKEGETILKRIMSIPYRDEYIKEFFIEVDADKMPLGTYNYELRNETNWQRP